MAPPAGATPEDDRRAYLREFIAAGLEGYRTRDLQDRYLTVEAEASVHLGGEDVPYRELPVRIRKTDDRAERQALEDARLAVVESTLNPILADALDATHAVSDELLGVDYDTYCQRLARLDFDALETRAAEFLAATADAHEDLLRWFAKRGLPGVPRDEIRTHDLGRLLYGDEHADLFPGRGMVERLTAPVVTMGIDPTAGGRIEFDLEERPRKTPRAFCSPIRVPEDVKLVLRPFGGADDYATFLHELGHALHFAHVDPEQPVEFARLGDNGVTEGYAMTMDHLMLVPAFLRRVVGLSDPEPFLRFAAFRELVIVRRYCAKLSYERSLHRDGPSPSRADEYVERLTAATGARAPAGLWLEDVDPHFYCVRYLRAWMLAGVVHRALRERFDEDWFLNPRTGSFLIDLWSLGQARPAEALAVERLGVETLDFGPLKEMIDARI